MKHFTCTTVAVLALLVCLPLLARAEGNYVSPAACGIYWTTPTTNTDGTALTDLKEFRAYILASPPADWNTTIKGGLAPRYVTPATGPVPTVGQQYRQDCRDLPGGQGYTVITAVNLAGTQSAASNQVAFVFVATVPGSAPSVEVRP